MSTIDVSDETNGFFWAYARMALILFMSTTDESDEANGFLSLYMHGALLI